MSPFLSAPTEQPRGQEIFRLRGIPFYVEPGFLMFVGFLMLYILFESQNLVLVVLFGIVLSLSLIAHEAGHALMAQRFRLTPIRVSLVALGGYALHGQPRGPGQGLAVSLAGPAVTLGLVVLGYGLDQVPTGFQPFADFAKLLWRLNAIWLIFNMLPVFQLDGGRSVYYGLMFKFGHRQAMYYSLVTSLVTVAVTLLLTIKYLEFHPLIIFILGILGWQCWQMLQMHEKRF